MSDIKLSVEPIFRDDLTDDIHGILDESTYPKLTTDQIASMEPNFSVTPSATMTAAEALNLDKVANVVPEIAGAHNFDPTKGGRVGVASKSIQEQAMKVVATDTPFGAHSTTIGLQQTIGGADLSVFYLSEVPNMDDVAELPNNPETWRKELIVLELDSILSLSYSTVRERFPVRVLGNSHPVGFTSGPRTIAGHMAFAIFTNDVLGRLRAQVKMRFERLRRGLDRANANMSSKDTGSALRRAQSDYNTSKEALIQKQQKMYEMALDLDKVMLLDQLPKFHLLCMGVNEQGTFSKFMIRDVRIIDENQYQGTTQPNIVNKVSWVAEDIVPMATFARESTYVSDSLGSITENFSHVGYNSNLEFNVVTGSNLLNEVNKDLKKDIIGD